MVKVGVVVVGSTLAAWGGLVAISARNFFSLRPSERQDITKRKHVRNQRLAIIAGYATAAVGLGVVLLGLAGII